MALLGILRAGGGPADATSVTGDLAIRVTVTPSACSIENAALDFGTYVAGQEGPLDAATTVTFLAAAPGPSGSSSMVEAWVRKRRGASSAPVVGALTYGLYQDGARARPAGSGGAAVALNLAARGNGTLALHGRIPGHQLVGRGPLHGHGRHDVELLRRSVTSREWPRLLFAPISHGIEPDSSTPPSIITTVG